MSLRFNSEETLFSFRDTALFAFDHEMQLRIKMGFVAEFDGPSKFKTLRAPFLCSHRRPHLYCDFIIAKFLLHYHSPFLLEIS